jgi:hypothetical protein
MKGSFCLPRGGIRACAGARKAYSDFYGWPWPHSDDFLRELAREVPSQAECKKAGQKETEWLLDLMRECDATNPPAEAQQLAEAQHTGEQ